MKVLLDDKNNEINKLKTDLNNIKIENDKLKSELSKANKIISGINQIDNEEVKKLKEVNINLKKQLNIKENEIKNLEIKIKNNIIERPKYDINDIIVITFVSAEVHYGIKCLPNETFAEVEEKLYQKYEDLRNTNNMFTVNAKPILRFKKIKENNIHDGDIIQLFKLE